MIKFNESAMRPMADDASSTRIAAANDLVKRTLSQHGLLPGGATSGLALPEMPAMEGLLARFKPSLGKREPPYIPVPDGAKFTYARFSCAAGTRAYRKYVPSTATEGVTGIVVMLHGCTQTPEDFAAGTGMNTLAEQHRFVVLYPQQARGDNAQSCWNWFSRGDQQRDRGEPTILAGMTREVMAEFGISRDCTFVAGLSAGAAMAVILGETYPDVFAAVGAHSGLPFGAATDVPSASAAMAGTGPQIARTMHGKPAPRTIIFHGSADATVHPANGDRIAQSVLDRSAPQTIQTEEKGNISGRNFTCKITSNAGGATALEHWVLEGLGHAWSGGQPQGSYTDPNGPDASAEMIRFFFEGDGGRV